MSLLTALECDACGDVAVEKADGLWEDGETVQCRCGAKWYVSMDAEMSEVWLNPAEASP